MPHHILRRVTNITFAFLLAVFSVNLSGVMSLQNVQAKNTPNVPICHATNSQSNPYTENTVDTASIDNSGNQYLNGHGDHTGPVWYEGIADHSWGDIIPPFVNDAGHSFAGYNWTPEGQAIYNNGCAIPLPKDAKANVAVSDPTCITAGSAAVTGLSFATLNGTLNQTPGSHTAVFTATTGHHFANGTTTLSVGYTIADKLSGAECIVNDATAAITVSSATCSAKGVASINVANTTHATLNGSLSNAVGTHTATFTAVAGHAFAGGSATLNVTYTIPAKLTGAQCDTPVIPTAPTPAEACGVHADKYMIPKQTGVRYEVKIGQLGMNEIYAPINDGSWTTLGASSVKIRAIAKTGYVLSNYNGPWTLNFDTSNCEVEANVTPHPVCGAGDSFTIPLTAHVTYKKVTTSWQWVWIFWVPVTTYQPLPAGNYPATGNVTIKAFAHLGYNITGQDTWTFNFDSNPCGLPFNSTNSPLFVDKCGIADDKFTINPAQGVTYKVNGNVTQPGSYPGNGTVMITAEATDPLYTLTGTTSWSHNFDMTVCPATDPCAPSMVTLDQIVLNNQNPNNPNCTPGRGNAGGPPPTTSTPPVATPPIGTTLPQTGGEAPNTLVALATIILSGILTYAAAFYLVNRRNFTNE